MDERMAEPSRFRSCEPVVAEIGLHRRSFNGAHVDTPVMHLHGEQPRVVVLGCQDAAVPAVGQLPIFGPYSGRDDARAAIGFSVVSA